MRTKCYNVFKFEELTPEAQKKAIEKLRDINTDHDWFQFSIHHWKEVLAENGFTNAEISFSGFCCQGDGASFKSDIDLTLAVKGVKRLERFASLADLFDIRYSVKRTNSRYSHEYTALVDWDYGNQLAVSYDGKPPYPAIAVRARECLTHLQLQRLDFCRKIYRDLEKEYYALQEDEAVIDTIQANEYEFDENGNLE